MSVLADSPQAPAGASIHDSGAAPLVKRRRALHIRNVTKYFEVDEEPLHVLDDVSFTVHPGEFVSILGASGCGKSTLLRLIVGLDDDYRGEILLGDEPVRGTSLDRGVVFQDHRLLPWLTVEDNVGLGLQNSPLSKVDRKRVVQEHLDLVGLNGFEKVYPYQLSGGMAQRVAIARGLVNRPEILLLDEPLGALDAITRINLQEEILRIWKTEGISNILVTHDVEEAIYLSDRIVILDRRPGRIKKILKVNLSRPRDRVSHAFADIKRELIEELAIANPGAPADPSLARNI
ncbi:MAG: ABC transporter ATP-binding protein [Opitutaceae bacterium]|nr:ABC transporter ATP-binding protein [Opitutaceae bacterium]